jgi:hypothetical protein
VRSCGVVPVGGLATKAMYKCCTGVDMPFGFYQFYMAYGGPNYNDFDFTSAFDLDDIGDGSAEFHGVLRDLARRASDSDYAVQLGVWRPEEPLLAVEFPAGDTSRYVFIHRRNYALYQDIPFGEYEFLVRYDAVWNKHFDTVEASVDWAGWGSFKYLGDKGSPRDVVIDQLSGAELRLGLSSSAAQALLGLKSTRATLTLAGGHIGSAAEAAEKLESMGTSFLFQVSLADGNLCSLVEIPSGDERSAAYASVIDTYRWDLGLSFPQRIIEPKPLALYYYAGTLSDRFPLLKFLAYYQVLEYYFGRYSPARVARTGRREYVKERDQIKAVITSCVDHRSLHKLLTGHCHGGVALCDHLANSRRLRGVNVIEVNREDDTSILSALADRIYDIRNRIVHAKESFMGADGEPFFPFSEESKALGPDIEILRNVAAAVLIESATSIT